MCKEQKLLIVGGAKGGKPCLFILDCRPQATEILVMHLALAVEISDDFIRLSFLVCGFYILGSRQQHIESNSNNLHSECVQTHSFIIP